MKLFFLHPKLKLKQNKRKQNKTKRKEIEEVSKKKYFNNLLYNAPVIDL